MIRLGYKDSTMIWYRGAWRRLQRYFAACGVEEFSLDVAMQWVDEACGFFAKEQAGTLKQTDVYLFRVAQMLGDYEAHGAVVRRYSRTVSKLSADQAAVVADLDPATVPPGCTRRCSRPDLWPGCAIPTCGTRWPPPSSGR